MGTEFFWFYDVILAAVLIGMVFLGVKRGFVKMLLSLVSVLVAFIASILISGAVSGWVYESFVEQPLESGISESIDNALGENVVTQLSKVDMSKATINGKTISSLDLKADDAGKITVNLNKLDLSKTGINNIDLTSFGVSADTDFSKINLGTVQFYESDIKNHDVENLMLAKVLSDNIADSDISEQIGNIADKINEALPAIEFSSDTISGIDKSLVNDVVLSVLEVGENPGKAVLDNVIKPVILIPIQTLIFILLFVIILVVLSLIIKATSVVNKIPLIGGVNQLLGGVLGVVQGFIVLFIIVIIVHLAVAVTGNTLIFLNEMTINKSYVFGYVYNLSFLNFLS